MNGVNQDRGQNQKLVWICLVFRTIMNLLCIDLPCAKTAAGVGDVCSPTEAVWDLSLLWLRLSLQHCIPISAFPLLCLPLCAVPCQASLPHLLFFSSHNPLMLFFFIQKPQLGKIHLLLSKYISQAPFQPKNTNCLDGNSSGHRSSWPVLSSI